MLLLFMPWLNGPNKQPRPLFWWQWNISLQCNKPLLQSPWYCWIQLWRRSNVKNDVWPIKLHSKGFICFHWICFMPFVSEHGSSWPFPRETLGVESENEGCFASDLSVCQKSFNSSLEQLWNPTKSNPQLQQSQVLKGNRCVSLVRKPGMTQAHVQERYWVRRCSFSWYNLVQNRKGVIKISPLALCVLKF